jgi:hypothetical protein
LTFARKREATEFARSLLVAELNRRKLAAISPARLLGVSAFDASDDYDPGVDHEGANNFDSTARFASESEDAGTIRENVPAGWRHRGRRVDVYSPQGPVGRAFVRLANTDPTFASYLARRGIDLEHLELLTPADRAAKLRKVRNLVVVRDFFRSNRGNGRSRKTYALYAGAQSLLSLVDGNPRLLIAMLRQLLPPGSPPPTRPITATQQSAAIESALNRFNALLGTLPGSKLASGEVIAVLDVLDSIGSGLAARIIDAPFSDNAPCAFRVDSDVDAFVIECLGQAANAGAIVHVPARGEAQQLSPGLTGEVFRLSYLLAPYYGLPLRLGKEVALSSLLPSSWKRSTGQRADTPARRNRGQVPGQESML